MSKVWTHITCPVCGERIKQPFTRNGTPVSFVHTRPYNRSAASGGRGCRIVVVTSLDGEKHKAWQIPEGVSMEAELESAVERFPIPGLSLN